MPGFTRCHLVAALTRPEAADLVVVNHHLLLADPALKDEGFGELLPGAEAVVLDEAHQVPEIAAQFFGASFATRQVAILARCASRSLGARGSLRSRCGCGSAAPETAVTAARSRRRPR